MRTRIPALLLAAVCGLSLFVLADDKPAPDAKAMMEQMMKLMAPGDKHAALKPLVGTFKATATMYEPGKPATTSEGESTNTLVYDGRFLKQDYKGTFMEQPFTGTGYWGHDNVTGKYQGFWVDSMSTGMMLTEGTFDATGKILTLAGDMSCPQTMSKMRCRQVVTIVSDSEHKFEMYCPGPDGKEALGMSIVYKKAK